MTEDEWDATLDFLAGVFDGDLPNPDDLPEATPLKERVAVALRVAVQYGGIDGGHHKDWVIDQMVRALAGPGYHAFVNRACMGEDGPDTYAWNEGIAP